MILRQKSLFSIAILLLIQTAVSQNKKTIPITFVPIYENQALELNKKYVAAYKQNDIVFTEFKCYVSHFEFYKNSAIVFSAKDTCFLLDDSQPSSLNRSIDVPADSQFDEIKFYMGIDDITNDKGISGGDLDPAKGMYWTWQTGYINLKLEGKCNLSNTNDKGFQFHLGGFLPPYTSFQMVGLKPISTEKVSVIIDVSHFMESFNLTEINTVMSPSEKSVLLSKNAVSMFHL